jgi:polysaccharide export outer membrane protein
MISRGNAILFWLFGFLPILGCQGVSYTTPKSTTPADFFQAKTKPQPPQSSPIRLVSAQDNEIKGLPPAQPVESHAKIDNRVIAKQEIASHASPAPNELLPAHLACAAPGSNGADVPRELSKIFIPDYIIEPPDILLIEAIPSLPDQPVQGEHLVRPDGTVNLGTYGSVRVGGMTLDQARAVIKEHLSQYIKNVKLNVDVFAYNSKRIYIVADGGGFGQQVYPLPFTGNETVLDAIGQIGGLPTVASKKKIWVARPNPDDTVQTLPVDWKAITQAGLVSTNYQLFPGDRIYIESDRLISLDGLVTKIVTPMERIFGVTYLGARTVFQLQNMGRGALAGGGF